MKIAISLLVFIFTLTLAHITLAEENVAEKMNSLFPPKAPNAALAIEPSKTQLLEPAAFAKVNTDKVTLKWAAAAGADQYHLQVATDAAFKWLVTNEYALTATSFEQGGLEAGKHYFWRVNSVTDKNEPTHRKSGFTTSSFETTAK